MLNLVLGAKRDAHRLIDTTRGMIHTTTAALHLLLDDPKAAAERAIRILL